MMMKKEKKKVPHTAVLASVKTRKKETIIVCKNKCLYLGQIKNNKIIADFGSKSELN